MALGPFYLNFVSNQAKPFFIASPTVIFPPSPHTKYVEDVLVVWKSRVLATVPRGTKEFESCLMLPLASQSFRVLPRW